MQVVEEKKSQTIDPYFRVEVLAQTPNPQQLIWISQHQCVCEGAAIDDPCPNEDKAGEYVVKHLLAGDRGHYSPLEAPQISFNVIGFNHRTMQQITRHRIGVHFSVQSFRYTGDRVARLGKSIQAFCDELGIGANFAFAQRYIDDWVIDNQSLVESIFYIRPIGTYKDREGSFCEYGQDDRIEDLKDCAYLAYRYFQKLSKGMPEEQAAGLLPMDSRQHWVMSANARSLMHMLDLRKSKAAQLEAEQLCDLIFPHFKAWVPAISEYYEQKRLGKARLAP